MSNTNTHPFPSSTSIPEAYQYGNPVDQHQYLFNGELHTWSGEQEDVYSPIYTYDEGKYSKTRLGSYPLLDKTAINNVLGAALQSWDHGKGIWATMPAKERIASMLLFIKRMKEKKKEVVTRLMWEIGKSAADSEKEFDRTIEYMFDTIDALKNLERESSKIQNVQGVYAQIRRGPLGVVLCMGPYNYPLNETFCNLIPALIMGNSVILKPARFGVLLLEPLMEAFRDCFPKGVINIIYGHGPETSGVLMESGKIDVLAFIGTSRVANILKKLHPQPNRLRAALGLEAKNPGIVLKDADIDATIEEVVMGTLSFNGQRCTALKILFVHSSIVNQFNKKLCDRISALKKGMPWEEKVMITPLPEPDKINYLNSLIWDACEKGASVINTNGGTFTESLFIPAVLYPVNKNMRVYSEEQFGPVIPIVAFDKEEEPISYIEESNYGQQVSLFGKDASTMAHLIDQLVNQVCRVNINSQCQRGPDVYPFNGRKDSAEGTLSVHDALRVFSIRTLVAAKSSDSNKEILSDIIENRKSRFLSTDYPL